MSDAVARGAPIIDDSAQRLEKCRRAVDLVDDDEPANLGTQQCIGVREPAAVDRPLEVEVKRPRLSLRRDLSRQSRLADLTRAEQHYARHVPKAILDDRAKATGDRSYTPGL